MAEIYVLKGTVNGGQKKQEINNQFGDNWCGFNVVNF